MVRLTHAFIGFVGPHVAPCFGTLLFSDTNPGDSDMARYFKRFGNWFAALSRPWQWLLVAAVLGINWLVAERFGYAIGKVLYRVLD